MSRLKDEIMIAVWRLQLKSRLRPRVGSYHYFGPHKYVPRHILRARSLEASGLSYRFEVDRLLGRQYDGDYFSRMDVIVRLIAAEDLRRGETSGVQLYEKMQAARRKDFGVEHSRDDSQSFAALQEAVSAEGLSDEHPLVIDDRGRLIDGSHRLALALQNGVERVAVEFTPRYYGVDYGLRWFARSGFTAEEIERIRDRFDVVAARYGLFFPVILWPPVASFFDEIEQALRREYRVVDSADLDLGGCFDETVRAVYECDDVLEANIDKKIAAMRSKEPRLRVIFVELGAPDYRRKIPHRGDISRHVEKLKRRYRRLYAKRISDYVYDNVMHMPDNYEHCLEVTTALHRATGVAMGPHVRNEDGAMVRAVISR